MENSIERGDNTQVDILIATYNGSSFLEHQLASIVNQTIFSQIKIFIRDDSSTDSTRNIIKKYSEKYSEKVFIVEDKMGKVGVTNNFRILMSYSKSKYFMFCDQDDEWFKDKVELLMQIADARFNEHTPCLVYSNSRIFSENSDSEYLGYYYPDHGEALELRSILFLNGGLQGCSMLGNRCLMEKMQKLDCFWHMHDQVATFLATLYGNVFYCRRPLALYRVHKDNLVGRNRVSLTDILRGFRPDYVLGADSFRFISELFSKVQGSIQIKEEDRFALAAFLGLAKSSKIVAVWVAIQNNFKLHGSLLRLLLKIIIAKRIIQS